MQAAKSDTEKAAVCAACGVPFTCAGFGRYKDFCSVGCRKSGRSFCKGCDQPLAQDVPGYVKDFCNHQCQRRFYNIGKVSDSYLEEIKRSVCKGCGTTITHPKNGIKAFCSKQCWQRYHRTLEHGQNALEKWGTFGPETRKVIREVEDVFGKGMAQRLATAIDREYILRTKRERLILPRKGRKFGKRTKHICKECGKEFGRTTLVTAYSRDYCSHRCELKSLGVDATALRGEDNPRAKLTWEQVDEIRKLYEAGKISKMALARMYGITDTAVRGIVTYRTWKPEHAPRHKG